MNLKLKIATRYIDRHGSVEAEIQNDSEQLVLNVAGTKFISRFFDDFEIENREGVPDRFSLNGHNELIACQLICELPITLLHKDEELVSMLGIDLRLDSSDSTSYQTFVIFSITMDNREIRTNKVQHFEGGLEGIIKELPEHRLKCCYGCAFADYSVYGQQFFGTMLCFRNIKAEYTRVRNKDEYMDIMDNHDRLVQETYLCNEFEERQKGTGYRG